MEAVSLKTIMRPSTGESATESVIGDIAVHIHPTTRPYWSPADSVCPRPSTMVDRPLRPILLRTAAFADGVHEHNPKYRSPPAPLGGQEGLRPVLMGS